jgi:hypothetical protein
MVVTGPRTSRLLSRAENDNRYSRQSLLHLPDEKDLNVKLNRVKEKIKNLGNGDIKSGIYPQR